MRIAKCEHEKKRNNQSNRDTSRQQMLHKQNNTEKYKYERGSHWVSTEKGISGKKG